MYMILWPIFLNIKMMKRTKSLRSILWSRCCILHVDYRSNMGMPRNSTLKPPAWEPRYKLVITSQLVCVFMPIDLTKWNRSHCIHRDLSRKMPNSDTRQIPLLNVYINETFRVIVRKLRKKYKIFPHQNDLNAYFRT